MSTLMETEKLSKVLNLFLLPNYNVVSTTYLDLLLTHISTQLEVDDKGNDQGILLKNWIKTALDLWYKSGGKPCQAVTVFSIKLIGILSRNEDDFDYFENEDIFNKLSTIFELEKNDLSASIKMAYTTMLLDVISHKIGRRWVISKGVWKDIVKFAQLNHTMYVTRESHRFLCQLLNEEYQNKKICKEIILIVSEPLITNNLKAQRHVNLEQIYLDQNATLCATLDLITNIIESTIFTSMENDVTDMFEEFLDLEARLRVLVEACISTRFLKHVLKLWILLSFRRIKNSARIGMQTIDTDSWEKFREPLCYLEALLIEKKYIIEFVRVHEMSLIYWKKLNAIKKIQVPYEHKFEIQVIVLMITPLASTIRPGYIKHDFFKMFVDKLFDISCQPVQRLSYLIRDIMLREKLPVEMICKSSIEMILELVDIIERDVAVIAFQTMCYVLKNYMPEEKICQVLENQNFQNSHIPQSSESRRKCNSIFDGDPVVDNPILLSTLLHGLAVMTEKFQFKWQDCVETICVLSLAQEILNHTGALPSLCVKALQLCKLAIENFMPPNLALLVESDSHMNGLGSELYKRLHDPNWEVRDSVLEVLITIATISEDKYPAFQKFLLANNFLQLITDIATMDGESYVRASAIKFLATTVKINKLWDESLAKMDLLEKIVKLFKEESEAVVRRESVDLIKELYVYRIWPKAAIQTMSSTMAEAAVLDLHWEVKVNALNFWKHFIKSHFTDQGMLDGSFPNVTFSKEHRKIVTLNECEIKRRLNKALDDVAKHSCLGVLLVTLENDSDFIVSKSAAEIIMKLKTFIIKYKLNEPICEENASPKDSAIFDSSYIKPPSTQPSTSQITTPADKLCGIIDEIVEENDANLLASIYQNSMNMNNETENMKKLTLDKLSSVTRQKFLSVISEMDIERYINERRRWLEDYPICFDSVLEDILTVYEKKSDNSMDCY